MEKYLQWTQHFLGQHLRFKSQWQHLLKAGLAHMNNLTQIKKESFGVLHWMLHHPLSPVPPSIKFKRVSSHKDALSRQLKEALLILREGTLNKRDEFSNNEVVRMETTRYTWDKKLEQRKEDNQHSTINSQLGNFCYVMKNIVEQYR